MNLPNNMKSLIPFAIIFVCGLVYFYYISPTIQEINQLTYERNQFRDVMDGAQELTKQRESIKQTYNQIDTQDIDRLQKIIPNTFDSVAFANDISALAARYGIKIEQIAFNSPKSNVREEMVGVDPAAPYRTTVVTFSASGTYPSFKLFVNDLEYSLRLLDITQVGIAGAGDSGRSGTDRAPVSPIMNYQLELKTYSLQ